MKFDLYSRDGSFIRDVTVQSRNAPPDLLVWAARFFIRPPVNRDHSVWEREIAAGDIIYVEAAPTTIDNLEG